MLPKEGLKHDADIIKNDKEKQSKEVKKEKDGITKGKYKKFKYYIIYFFFRYVSIFQSNNISC